MWFRVDPRLPTPVYQQVVDGIKEAVAKGLLKPRDRLPAVRELAMLMMLNHNTVAKAYQELERERVIEVIRGRGTYVAAPSLLANRSERIVKMSETIKQLCVEAYYLQMTEDDLLTLFQDLMNEWKREKGRNNT